MKLRIVRAVAATTFREFWRTPEAVFWTYAFPVLVAVVLGFSFRPHAPKPVEVAVVAAASVGEDARSALAATLRGNARLRVQELDAAAADRALARGRIDLLVRAAADGPVLRSDPARPEAELARVLVERTLRDAHDGPGSAIASEAEDRPGSRYIDFLIPALIGLNLLGAGMWGVGYNLVQMRVQKLLRRLFVTPLRPSEFVLGFMFGRFVLMVPEALAVLAFGVLAWGVPFRGSVLAFTLLVLAGSLAFTGLGCLIASRARTTEVVAGLMNLVQLPMWLLGGVFFDVDRLDGLVRWAAEAMPLTHLNRALRDVMLEPGSLADVAVPLAAIGGFGALTFALALRLFRWQ